MAAGRPETSGRPTKQPCTRQFDRKQACADTFLNVLENPNVGIPFIVQQALAHLHHEAHEICFIANSVKTQVTVE